jgi:hypothetical protein
VDGLLATADIAEDLLLLGALEDKVVVASMNRGGLAGASFELDDRMTGYDVAAWWRPASTRPRCSTGSTSTTRARCGCWRPPAERHRAGPRRRRGDARALPVPAGRRPGQQRPQPRRGHQSVHIAQGLGATSAYTWLKLPVVADMARVMDATTLPTLLLGGDPSRRPDGDLRQLAGTPWRCRPCAAWSSDAPALPAGRRRRHRRGHRGRPRPLNDPVPRLAPSV